LTQPPAPARRGLAKRPAARYASAIMEFIGRIAALQQRLAGTEAVAERRKAVLSALAPTRGERVLEIGCGAGLLLREVGLATGPHGLAAGVDISLDQILAARATCAEVPAVKPEVGDATHLAWPDAAFDALVAVEALEHIAPVEPALAEMRRVLKPGGRLIALATNWTSAFWHGADASLTAEITAAWAGHAAHANLPARLPHRLTAAGFEGIRQFPVPVVDPDLHDQSFAWWIARLMAVHATQRGVSTERTEIWLAELDAAQEAGDFFFSMVPILTEARAA